MKIRKSATAFCGREVRVAANIRPSCIWVSAAKTLPFHFGTGILSKAAWSGFFVDGDDGYGSVDHMLRVKLMRTGIQLQIDSHSLDPNHPDRQNNSRPADKVSGAYRLNMKYPRKSIDLTKNMWHDVRVQFYGETVTITLDEEIWKKTLKHACFDQEKTKSFMDAERWGKGS